MRARSPVYQGLGEAILGAASIRAFDKIDYFEHINMEKCAHVTRLWFTIICGNRWMCIRMRLISIVFLSASVLYIVLQDHLGPLGWKVSAPIAGLMLRYAVQVTTNLESVLMSLTLTEMSLVSLERITAYAEQPQEDADQPRQDVPIGWPASGKVVFNCVTMRYAENLPVVLDNVSLDIPGGTSVGVVGRTGSGKSSLIQAMFRMYPLDCGHVLIDGKDIASISLQSLWSQLAIIPQDPVGFGGTLRFNLDPFNKFDDAAILDATRESAAESLL